MSNSPIKTLAEITTLIKRGRAPSYANDGVAVVSQKCVRDGNRFDPSVVRRTDANVKPIPDWAYLRVGDILVNSTGRGTLGRACYLALLNEPSTADGHVSIVRVDDGLALSEFVGDVLSARQKDLEALQSGSTSQTELSPTALGSLRMVVPSLSEQRRIVDLISALDAQIKALDAETNACAAMLACLAAHLFVSLVGTLDLTSVMTEIRSGGTPSRKCPDFYEGSIPWLKSGEVASSWIYDSDEKITARALAESSAWVVPAGSVVVAMYGATAAQVGYLGAPMATNQAVLALVPNQGRCDGRFAYHWFRHHSQRLKAAASGAAQPNLSKAVILREVAYPEVDLEQQANIGQVLDAQARVGDLLVAERDALRAVRATALRGLLSGEVDILESYDALLTEAV